MLQRHAFTLMELIVVIVIIGVIVALAFPNFTASTEQAGAANARNNLLAIYGAEQNFNNNNNTVNYCTRDSLGPGGCDSITTINTSLSLNIQNYNNTYSYLCAGGPSANPPTAPTCTATRINSPANLVLTLTLNAPIVNGNGGNPTCTSTTNNTNWCP